VIATIRGLLLDLLATGDRDRVQDAAESFLATLSNTRRGRRGRVARLSRRGADPDEVCP
jgi:hypothetical protein